MDQSNQHEDVIHHHHHHHHHYHHGSPDERRGPKMFAGDYDRQAAGYNQAGFTPQFGGGYGGYPMTGQGRRGWSTGYGGYAGFSQGQRGYGDANRRDFAGDGDYFNGGYSGAGYQPGPSFAPGGQQGGYSESYNQNWITGAGQQYDRGYQGQGHGQGQNHGRGQSPEADLGGYYGYQYYGDQEQWQGDRFAGSHGRSPGEQRGFGGGYYGTPYYEQRGFGGYAGNDEFGGRSGATGYEGFGSYGGS